MTFLALLLGLAFPEGDRELVERLKRRDPEALAELYDRFGRLAYSVIVAIVRDAGIAEDLVQETFLRVWNRVQAFRARRNGSMAPYSRAQPGDRLHSVRRSPHEPQCFGARRA